MIGEDAAAHGLTSIREMIANWDPHPTFFEIVTALALQHFKEERCEIVALETGMGGRLDATNAITPLVSVITPIDYDHQQWLGNSLGEIAAEKAGIIKPRVPVVSASQSAEAASVIRIRARECEAPLEVLGADYDGDVALKGAHQKENAAIAIAALSAARIEVSQRSVATGLTSVNWPARFQRWNDRIIIDGAHNPAGVRMLVRTWREIFGDEKAALVFGALQDKQVREILLALNEIAQSVQLPAFHGARVVAPAEMAAIFNESAAGKPVSIHQTCGEAIEAAQRTGARVLIAGSLHLAGEALAYLQGQPAAFEECDQ
jgi:dihydrofolate synthase/folylpolyglutamate synthase